MDQNDVQHIALVLLELQINLGRAVRENARLQAAVADLTPKPPEPEAPPKEG